jgi:hypothetical protein
MSNPNAFLSTLAESAAAIVAIVGGFLVSRLVALSSERDGLRRQLAQVEIQRQNLTTAYEDTHEQRLHGSQRTFGDWVVADIVEAAPNEPDRATLLEKIPRGSSVEEMSSYLDFLIQRVGDIVAELTTHIRPGDTRGLQMSELEARGLIIPTGREEFYLEIFDEHAKKLPRDSDPFSVFGTSSLTPPLPSLTITTDVQIRRLDELINREETLQSQKLLLDAETQRLQNEMATAGRPTGVTPAIVVLSTYAATGVVAPIVAMAISPSKLSTGMTWLLVVLFVGGLIAVLGYIAWYAHGVTRHQD